MALSNTNPKLEDLLDVFAAIPETIQQTKRCSAAPTSRSTGTATCKDCLSGESLIVTHSDAHEASGLYLLLGDEIAGRVRLPPARTAPPFLNHCGGCQRIGDYLVIPNEAIFDPLSRISFFDISNLSTPVELTSPPPIDLTRKTGAAGVANITIAGTGTGS